MTAAAPARSAPRAGVAGHAPPAGPAFTEYLVRDADATDIAALFRAAL